MFKIKINKIGVWFADYYHLLFKSAAINHLRIKQILESSDGTYQLTVKFDSYSELKKYQKKLRRLTVSLSSAVAMVIVAVIVSPYILNPNRSSAASYFWSQTSWNSAASSSATISKPGPGTTFQSMDSNIEISNAAPSDSQITLKSLSGNKSQTNNGDAVNGFNVAGSDFDSGKVSIPNATTGTGTDGNVQLAQAIVNKDIATTNETSNVANSAQQGGWSYGDFNNSSTQKNATSGDGSSVILGDGGPGKIAAGSSHTCILKTDGLVYCWGDNVYGQLGNNTTTQSNIPAQVLGVGASGNLTNISAISAGSSHTCALKTDGTVYCWGANSTGQLGNNSTTQRNAPVQVLGVGASGNLTDVSAISAGGNHTCALKTDGTVFCWGQNTSGHLGNNTTTQSNTPVQVLGVGASGYLTSVASISAGYAHTCALKTDKTVFCWGQNANGQLGNNSTTQSNTPVQVLGVGASGYLTDVSAVSAGRNFHTCALKTDGSVYCWGYNYYGQLGNNSTIQSNIPVQVLGVGASGNLTDVSTISIGASHSCANKTDGAVFCWGINSTGQLGNNSTAQSNIPVQVLGVGASGNLTNISGISAGGTHSCTIKTDGTIYCWGANSSGQLGNNSTSQSNTPIQSWLSFAYDYLNASKVAVGADITCAVKNGNVYCGNSYSSPVLGVGGTGLLSGIISVTAGVSHFCALKSDGTVYCWGANNWGQLSDGTSNSSSNPVQVKTGSSTYLTGISYISAGGYFTCAASSGGSVFCWGNNQSGQFGNGTTSSFANPYATGASISGVSRVESGSSHVCALKTDGTAYCWGTGSYGALGNNSISNSYSPVQVLGVGGSGYLTSVSDISAGQYHSCAIKTDGTGYCWGENAPGGKLGNNSTAQSNVPVQVSGLTGASSISAFMNNSCASKTDGTAYCWGYGNYGQNGNGLTSNYKTPTLVSISNVSSLAKGSQAYHVCALKANGDAYCWGKNDLGALHDKTTTNRSTPVQPIMGYASITYINTINGMVYKNNGTYSSYFDSSNSTRIWKTASWTKTFNAGDSSEDFTVKIKSSSSTTKPTYFTSDGTSGGTACQTISAKSLSSVDLTAYTSGCVNNSDQYLWYEIIFTNTNIFDTPSLDSISVNLDLTSAFQTAGTYTSAILDTGQKTKDWGNLVVGANGYTSSMTLNVKVRSCSTSNCLLENVSKPFSYCSQIPITQATTTIAMTSASPNNCVTNGDRYMQYQGIFAGDNTNTAKLNDVTLNYNYYPTSSEKFVSSPYDTSNSYTALSDIKWTAGGSGTIKFQTRSADSQANLATAQWCGPTETTGCSATIGASNDFYTSSTGNTINSANSDHSGNRWIQYAAFLSSDGSQAPTLNDVTLSYAFNTPPVVSVPTVSQLTTPTDLGKVNVAYQVNETKGDDGVVEQTSEYVNLFYQPSGVKLSATTGPLGNADTNATSGAVALDNPNYQSIPTQGDALIGTELVSFTSSGNNLTITGRHKNFSTGYPTLGAVHAQGEDVYFLAKNVTGANVAISGITEVPASKNIIWDAKNEPNIILNGNTLPNLGIKVVANDGDAFTPLGSNFAVFSELDLKFPVVNSITTDGAHTATGENTLYYNSSASQIPLVVNFSENVNFDATGGKTIILKLNSGVCTISSSIINSNSATCQYSIGSQEQTPIGEKLKLITPYITADSAITDRFGNALINFIPVSNLDAMTNIVIDNGVPTADDLDDITTNQEFSRTLTNVEDASGYGIDSYSWSKISGSGIVTFNHADQISTSISANADDEYYIQVAIIDKANNQTIKTMHLTWDTTSPSAAGKAEVPALTNDSTPNISWSGAADTLSGLVKYEVQRKIEGGNFATVATIADANDLAASSVSYDEPSELPDGKYYYQIIATDKAGNSSTSDISDLMEIDTTKPELTSFTSNKANVTAQTAYGKGEVIDIRAVYNEPLKSGSTMTVRLENSADPAVDVVLSNIESNVLAGTFTVDGPRKGYDTQDLDIRSIVSQSATDFAGNMKTDSLIPNNQNLADNKDIAIDTGTPILMSFTAKKLPSTTSGSFNEGETLRITAQYSKPIASGSITVHLNTENGSDDNTDVLLDNISSSTIYGNYTVQAGDNADSLQVASITDQSATDFKGNALTNIGTMTEYDAYFAALPGDPIASVTNIQNIQIDTAPPVLGTPAISYQITKTNNQTPAANISASDNFDLSDGTMQFSLNGTTWCAAVSYVSTYDFDITNSSCGGNSTNEVKTVSIKFKDEAGNESQTANTTIEYDNSKPVLQSIATEKDNGTYGPGAQIKIVAQYNEDLKAGSTLTIKLDNNKTITLDTIENNNQLTATYTVGATGSIEDTNKLRAGSILSQSVSDTSDPTNTQDTTSLSGISGHNIDDTKTIIIDTTSPTAAEPTGKFFIDRNSELNKVKVTIKPYDQGLDLSGITAQIKLQDTNTACDFTGATNETLSGETTFTYDDNSSLIKKACLKLTDKVGNVSSDIIAISPNTPQNFSYTDLTSETFTGAILKWDEPTSEGTGNFKKYNVLRCEGVDCTPNEMQEISNKSQNYNVFDSLTKGIVYCYSVAVEDNNGDISKSPSPICYAPGDGPISANTNTNFESEPYIANITKTSANVVFKTINGNDSSALATNAEVKVYADADLTDLVKTVSDSLNVTHAIKIDGLAESKIYYLKISATDTSLESNPNRTEIAAFDKAQDPTRYSFSTAGVLTSITNVRESLITDTKAVVTFITNQDAKCFIDSKDSLAANYNNLSDNIESNYFINHTITLTNLLPKTNYDYKITCSDGTVAMTSDEHHFVTQDKLLTQGEADSRSDKTIPEISNVALSSVAGENATITWNTNENANTLVSYEIEGAGYSMMVGDQIVNSSQDKYTTSHTMLVNNLIPATKYLFNVMSIDVSGNIGQSEQSTFTTKQPSSLSSIKVLSKALGQATISWTTGNATSSMVEYGLSTSYGQRKEDTSKVKEHSITLSELTPGEIYHFRVKGEDDQKNIFASSDITFQPKAPPKISDFKIDSITEHGAVVTFNTNVYTDAIINFENVDQSEDAGFQGKPEYSSKHEIKLKDLTSGAKFSVKLKVRDEDGNETEETFPNFTTTKDEVAPKIDRVKTDSALTQNDKVQAIISWSTDELATGEIVYKEGKNGTEKKFEVNSAPSFSHIGVITSFKSGIVYYFKVVSTDSVGNTVTSSDYALLTPKQRQNIIQIIIGNFTDIFGWAKIPR